MRGINVLRGTLMI